MNPTATARHPRPGVAVWVLAVLVALTGLFAPAASAATSTGPETRVRAIHHPDPASVGRVDVGSSTGVGVSRLHLRQLVSATGVATNTVDDLLPGLPAGAPKPLGLGSTGRVTPGNLGLSDQRCNGFDLTGWIPGGVWPEGQAK